MARSPDCIVIGAGIVGLLSARALAEAGLTVTVLERGAAGREASWAGGGILSPLYPWRYPHGVTALARLSQQCYPALAEHLHDETGIDPQWWQTGLLILDAAEQDAALDWARRTGTAMHRLCGGQVRSCEPALADPPATALWLPLVAQIRNPRLLQALRASLIARGVQLREHGAVRHIRVEAGRVRGVMLDDTSIAAERVVVAAGAWSGVLLDGLGIALDITPVRGQMLLLQARPGLVSRIVLHEGRYLIPRRDGRILVGSTLERTGFDASTTTEARRALLHSAAALVPALADCPLQAHWAGLRPGSADGVPCIGEHPHINGLYLNAGHFRNGLLLAPASAQLLADLIGGRPPLLDPAPYRIPPGSQVDSV